MELRDTRVGQSGPTRLPNDRHPHACVSHCLDWCNTDLKPALFRMHGSESWGQAHQSVNGGREDGDDRIGRDGDRGGFGWMGAKRKERHKVNGYTVAAIIRRDENRFISHRAEGMLGNDLKQASEAVMRPDVSVLLNVCRHISISNMKGTCLWLRRFCVNCY